MATGVAGEALHVELENSKNGFCARYFPRVSLALSRTSPPTALMSHVVPSWSVAWQERALPIETLRCEACRARLIVASNMRLFCWSWHLGLMDLPTGGRVCVSFVHTALFFF